MARWDSVGQGDAQFAGESVEWKEVFALSNDLGFCCRRMMQAGALVLQDTSAPSVKLTLPAANPC
jgi:hypothetical protein